MFLASPGAVAPSHRDHSPWRQPPHLRLLLPVHLSCSHMPRGMYPHACPSSCLRHPAGRSIRSYPAPWRLRVHHVLHPYRPWACGRYSRGQRKTASSLGFLGKREKEWSLGRTHGERLNSGTQGRFLFVKLVFFCQRCKHVEPFADNGDL